MFEFILTFSDKEKVNFPEFLYFDETIHVKHEISCGRFHLKYQSFKYNNSDDYYEDENKIIVLYGSIFSPINTTLPSQINAKYLAQNEYLLLEPQKYLRGNYAIIKYHKIDECVDLIIDPLGLKPIYILEQSSIIYLSSSLWALTRITNELDNEKILEALIFGYNITEKTMFKNISIMENGTKLTIEKGKVCRQKYFDLKLFISPYPSKYDLEELRSIFNSIVLRRIDNKNIIVTLTGGNDGRSVLSSVYYLNRKFQTFSFGMKNGENTFIPELIANKLSFNHYSVYLENSFIDEYFNNALDTIIYSDGNLSFEQQTTFYAFKKLAPLFNNSLLLTGLLAGEILGPIHLKHDYFNIHYFNLILNDIQLNEDYVEKFNDLKIIRKEFLNKHMSYLIYTINQRKKQLSEIKQKNEIAHLTYYFDLINLGFRKFYGMQMHLIRYYAENLAVFYDIDILDYILKTNYHYIFKNSFKSIVKRWNSRIPQSYITCRNYPELGKLKLDRGFPPENLLHPIKKYLAILPYLKRKYLTKDKHKDFDSANWCINYLNKISLGELGGVYFNTKKLYNYINNLHRNKLIYNPEINKMISIYSFLKMT